MIMLMMKELVRKTIKQSWNRSYNNKLALRLFARDFGTKSVLLADLGEGTK